MDLLIDNSDLANSNKMVLMEQQSDSSFINKAAELGIAITNPKGTITLDINRDGKIDILTTTNEFYQNTKESKIILLINETKAKKNKTFKLFIRGKNSNSFGLNTKVVLKTDEKNRMAWAEFNYGSLPSQNEEGLIFSIPQKEKIESLTVTFPYKTEDEKILKRTFNLDKFNKSNKSYIELTVCDNGKYYERKLYRCP